MENSEIKTVTIEPFGELIYSRKEKEWFGRIDGISDNNVELSIHMDNDTDDLNPKLEKVNQLIKDYSSTIDKLYTQIYQKLEETKSGKSLADIKLMYFLTAISVKEDNSLWVVMEPHYNVPSIYNHFWRFTIANGKVTWANL